MLPAIVRAGVPGTTGVRLNCQLPMTFTPCEPEDGPEFEPEVEPGAPVPPHPQRRTKAGTSHTVFARCFIKLSPATRSTTRFFTVPLKARVSALRLLLVKAKRGGKRAQKVGNLGERPGGLQLTGLRRKAIVVSNLWGLGWRILLLKRST